MSVLYMMSRMDLMGREERMTIRMMVIMMTIMVMVMIMTVLVISEHDGCHHVCNVCMYESLMVQYCTSNQSIGA